MKSSKQFIEDNYYSQESDGRNFMFYEDAMTAIQLAVKESKEDIIQLLLTELKGSGVLSNNFIESIEVKLKEKI